MNYITFKIVNILVDFDVFELPDFIEMLFDE